VAETVSTLAEREHELATIAGALGDARRGRERGACQVAPSKESADRVAEGFPLAMR
jgi:hypothetical protein